MLTVDQCTFQGGLVFKVHRLVYHSTLDWRVIKKKRYTFQGKPSTSAKRFGKSQYFHQMMTRRTSSNSAIVFKTADVFQMLLLLLLYSRYRSLKVLEP